MRKCYFPADENDPAPLEAVCERRVRFEEVDGIGMVWHGRFPSYLEDGRIAFGDAYGLSYQEFMKNHTVAPIVQMHVDYQLPLRFDERVVITSRLHWSEAARLNFSYTILGPGGGVAASGYTVQLMTDPEGTILLVVPEWLEAFRRKWKEGTLVKK